MDDEDPYATEDKVRELIKRKLRITREIPFNRVSRVFHGPEFRGQKPVQVSLTFLLTLFYSSASQSQNEFQVQCRLIKSTFGRKLLLLTYPGF